MTEEAPTKLGAKYGESFAGLLIVRSRQDFYDYFKSTVMVRLGTQ